MPFNTYRSGTMQASLAADPHRQTLFNAFASWMDGIVNDEEIARHVNKEKDPSIRVALFAIRDQLRNNLDSTYATQCVNRIADRRAQGVVRQLYAYGLDLLSPAMDAIRRNGGTALYVPDDYGLVLGPELNANAWGSQTGFTHSSGQVTLGAAAVQYSNLTSLSGALPSVGKVYRLSFNLTSGASVRLNYGGITLDSSAVGVNTKSGIATNATDLPFITAMATTGTNNAVLSSISVREIISATSFIDSTGTQPVTAVGDLVGLLTDRSYGAGNLGGELWVPASVSLGAGWSRLGDTFTTDGTSANLALAVLTTGKTYKFTATISGGAVNLYLGPSTFLTGATGAVSWVGVATDPNIYVQNAAAGAKTVTAVSVREVLGNHATQPTTASKPQVTQLANGTKALDFDGSNDLLTLSSGAILQQGSDHWVTAAFVLDAVGAEQAIYGTANASGASSVVAYMVVAPSGKVQGIWVSDASAVVVIESLSAVSTGTPYVATIRKVGGTFSLFLNGVLQATSTTLLGTTTVNAAAIGALVRSPAASYLNGKLIDIALGQTTLTEADRKTIERNMAQRAGVAYVG